MRLDGGRRPRERSAVRDLSNSDDQQNRQRAFSYYANRSQADLNTGRESLAGRPSERRASTRLQKLRRHSGWVIGSGLLLAAVLYQLQLSSAPRVVSLIPAAEAPFLRDTSVYARAAGKLIASSPANRNKLTINNAAIAADLRKQFPELQSVTVGLPFLGGQPTIYVRPADPALVLATNNETFIIDQQGRALSTLTSEAQLERLRVPSVTDKSNLGFKLGDQVLTRSVTAFIQSVARQHRAQSLDIRAMVLPAGASQLDVYPAGKDYFIKYNTQASAADASEAASLQAGSYEAVRRHLEVKRVTPTEYIDVRLPDRAYYK